jgi:hypothetical protein
VVNEHPAPACVTVKVLSATVTVPTRLALDRFVATMKLNFPDPVPGPALITAIHATLLSASHAHPAGAVTVLFPNPPSAETAWVVGVMVIAQTLGAYWVTVNAVPAIVTVPVRVAVPVFAATVKVTLPVPFPEAPAMMAIHAALALAVHAQPEPAVTVLPPSPPSLAKVWAGDVAE